MKDEDRGLNRFQCCWSWSKSEIVQAMQFNHQLFYLFFV